MTRFARAFLLAGTSVLGFVAAGVARAESVAMTIPSGFFAKNIGKSALSDPSGTTHTRQEVAGKVVVAIFSAPTPSQGDSQKQWSDSLATELPGSIVLVLVEDMTEAGLFKGIALSDMKQQFSPHSRPFLILDQNGDVFKKFGVPRDKTVILIYDKTGKLRDAETNLGDSNATLQRVQAIAHELQAD
jgi:hypothetical protein